MKIRKKSCHSRLYWPYSLPNLKNRQRTGKNTMTPLDKTDLKILEALQNDAKINAKTLAADLHLSKTPIYERIKRLEEEGVIKQY